LSTGAVVAVLALAAGAAPAAAFSARGSVEQVQVTDLAPAAKTSLLNRRGRLVAAKRADAQGAVLFRDVRPGSGYRVRVGRRGPKSAPLSVMSAKATPLSTDIYGQNIPPSGYGYLTTRDGTKLSIYVHPPQDVANALPAKLPLPNASSGPTPTLIEYSGYGYANPAGPTNGIAILANLMGFTVVDVNMRGTGCSGGAFDFFEPLQNLDGYDVIETIARQPWVLHHKVGMLGISYGGISQLFTAQLQPPSLAAITPLSVIDGVQTTLYPGGILNTGFAFNWAKERVQEALPAGPKAGQEWAYKRIQEGDQTCKANQVMHGQAADLLRKVRENSHYKPKVVDPLSPITFVHKINVPVFMACQWTDEQTGGHCPTLASRLTGTKRKWLTFTNGTHVDSLDPETFMRWYDFLQLYVARQAPGNNPYLPAVQAAAPVIYDEAMGVQGVTFPPDPIQQEPTYESALAAFEKLPSVRILFDNGAGGNAPGQPKPGFEQSFASWPVPGARARAWYLGPGGALTDAPPDRAGVNRFNWNAGARPLTDFTGDTAAGEGGLWTATPPYKWTQNPPGTALSYATAPLSASTTVLGAGAVRLWVRSSKPNADFQATISEIRPDGKEVFVQGGWVRGKGRRLDRRKSTPLEPVLSLRARDSRPLPRKKFTLLTIPLYYQGHAYRAGSRIRVAISAPNGDQPIWSFGETKPSKGGARIAVAFSKRRPSSLALPIVPGVNVPTGLPPCPGLRGQPCRGYQAFVNR
jgi:uncharacterized protein